MKVGKRGGGEDLKGVVEGKKHGQNVWKTNKKITKQIVIISNEHSSDGVGY